MNGRPIDSYLQLLRKVALLAPGTEARLTLQREGVTREVSVRLSSGRRRRPPRGSSSGPPASGWGWCWGCHAGGGGAAGRGGLSGALVSGVMPRSPADEAGLRAGDVVTEVNRRRVKDAAGVRAALAKGSAGASILLRVQRGDALQYVAIAR